MNMWAFVGHTASVASIQLYLCGMNAAIDNIEMAICKWLAKAICKYRQYENEWALLCSKNFLFIDTGNLISYISHISWNSIFFNYLKAENTSSHPKTGGGPVWPIGCIFLFLISLQENKREVQIDGLYKLEGTVGIVVRHIIIESTYRTDTKNSLWFFNVLELWLRRELTQILRDALRNGRK